MSRGGSRIRRVNESLREVIAGEILLLKDPGVGFVTVTGVAVTPDLRAARVYYSVLGDDEEKKATQAALDRAAPRIQRAVGREIRMKFNPVLEFVFDESVEKGLRMDKLLHEIAQAEPEEGCPDRSHRQDSIRWITGDHVSHQSGW